MSIFGVAFACSFNTPTLLASLSNEHALLPKWVGKTNKYDAPWVGIIMTMIVTCILVTQSYIFLVSCIVSASFVQYVPSILAVIKFKHNGQFPNHGFSLPGGYLIPILALLASGYLVFNFTWKTITVGGFVALLTAALYLFDGKKRFVAAEQAGTAPKRTAQSSQTADPTSAAKLRHHSYHIFYKQKNDEKKFSSLFIMCLIGIEPMAYRLGGDCSILLSYKHTT